MPAARSYAAYTKKRDEIAKYEGDLLKFSQGYLDHGFSVLPNGDVRYLEWIPNAERAYLIGEFSTLGAWRLKGIVRPRLTSNALCMLPCVVQTAGTATATPWRSASLATGRLLSSGQPRARTQRPSHTTAKSRYAVKRQNACTPTDALINRRIPPVPAVLVPGAHHHKARLFD